MNEFFDLYTLIYLVIAVVIFMRLRRVLGRRTGQERRPFDPYSETGNGDSTQDSDSDKVVPLPRPSGVKPGSPASPANWGEFAKPESPMAKAFDAFSKIDPTFEPRSFNEGARSAYEMIVTGFAAGDKKTLEPLLSKDVYEGFAAAISDREKRGETVESEFVSVDKVEIDNATLKKKVAHISVCFISKLISVTKDKDGKVVDGDSAKVRSMTDIWTFARDLTSPNPNWKVVATEAAE